VRTQRIKQPQKSPEVSCFSETEVVKYVIVYNSETRIILVSVLDKQRFRRASCRHVCDRPSSCCGS